MIHIEVQDQSGPDQPESKVIFVNVDLPEAKGHFNIEIAGYGAYLYLAGLEQPVALIDMFYQSDVAQDSPYKDEDRARLVIYDSDKEDAVQTIRFLDDGTRLRLEYPDNMEQVYHHANFVDQEISLPELRYEP